MRTNIFLTVTLAVSGIALQAADSKTPEFTTVSLADATREAEGRQALTANSQLSTTAAMWIWADKYVYRAGERLTLRWTVKPNNDLYPYTIVAFRQNNQTGRRFYLPAGTETVTDIFGNTVEQGFRITRLSAAEKAVLIGDGGLFPADRGVIPNELGMHTITVQVRDYTGTRVVKTAYFKIGVVDEFVDVRGNIDTNREFVNTKAYRVSGLVFVRNGAVLRIQPGTFVIGQPGSQPPSALIVTRFGRIEANGTRSRPIIMTSSQPFGQRRAGDWGGLVMLGSAPTNIPGGTGNIEGLTASVDTQYGGNEPAHNCGSLRYVRVEFAGAEFQPNEEVNAFTWGGCGTGTTAEYLQTTYGLDDAFEWFGGTMNAKYLVATYAADDYFDTQLGFTGKVQHGLALANNDFSNRGLEIDNSQFGFNDRPFGANQFYNMTIIGTGAGTRDEGTAVAGVWWRRGAAGSYNNFLIQNWYSAGVDARDQATQDRIDGNDLRADGFLLWNNGSNRQAANTLAGQVAGSLLTFAQGTRGTGRNFIVADPMLRRPFEYSDPDFRPTLGSPVWRAGWVAPPDDGFFDQWATWIGAFGDEDWTEEWTNFLQEQDIRP
jgi:hypothetical protein